MKYPDTGEYAEKKKWLARYVEYREEAQYWYTSSLELRTRVLSMTKPLSDMPRNPSPKRTDDSWIEHLILIDRCEQRIKNANAVIEEIETAINEVDTPKYRRFLKLRYMQGLTMEKVADQMKVNIRSLSRIQNRALDELVIPIER